MDTKPKKLPKDESPEIQKIKRTKAYSKKSSRKQLESENTISQNNEKSSSSQEKSKQLSSDEAKPDDFVEKAINGIHIGISEMCRVVKEIKNMRTGKEGVSLIDLMQMSTEKSDNENLDCPSGTGEDFASVQNNESLRVNVNSGTSTRLEEDMHENFNLIKGGTMEDQAVWRLIQRSKDELTSQALKEESLSTLREKLKKSTENFEKRYQECLNSGSQSIQSRIRENWFRELSIQCKIADQQIQSLKMEKEKLVNTLRNQIVIQGLYVYTTYQKARREKEALELEINYLNNSLAEQRKLTDELRSTIKTQSRQLEIMKKHFRKENDMLSTYQMCFDDFNNECRSLHEQILRKVALLELSPYKIESSNL